MRMMTVGRVYGMRLTPTLCLDDGKAAAEGWAVRSAPARQMESTARHLNVENAPT
jgi:hypothetical protein